jgi:predicted nucleic acid-binding protein
MSKTVFLDTNGWIALLNSRDALHPTADFVWHKLGRDGYTVLLTDWVIAETGNGLARHSRVQFAKAVDSVRNSSRAEIVYIDEQRLGRALALYASRQDKTWGLVDCSSFVVMEDARIREALTNDRHFEQAGFSCLLPLP